MLCDDDILLIGLASLFIANKYHDYRNLTSDYIYLHIANKKCTEEKILEMEDTIFQSIGYILGLPTESTFSALYVE